MRIDWIWLFLKAKGRLTRWPYFLATMLIYTLSSLVVHRYMVANISALPAEMLASGSMNELMQEILTKTPGLTGLIQTVLLVTLWPLAALTAKRAWDIGAPFWAGIALVFIGIWMPVFIVLSLFPGTSGPNAYGAVRNAPPAS